jgi:hypothetical protein
MCYFAKDGNYGGSECFIIDTTNFTSEDWNEIEEASDDDRAMLALQLAEKRTA